VKKPKVTGRRYTEEDTGEEAKVHWEVYDPTEKQWLHLLRRGSDLLCFICSKAAPENITLVWTTHIGDTNYYYWSELVQLMDLLKMSFSRWMIHSN
jgi:hypothetical protein